MSNFVKVADPSVTKKHTFRCNISLDFRKVISTETLNRSDCMLGTMYAKHPLFSGIVRHHSTH